MDTKKVYVLEKDQEELEKIEVDSKHVDNDIESKRADEEVQATIDFDDQSPIFDFDIPNNTIEEVKINDKNASEKIVDDGLVNKEDIADNVGSEEDKITYHTLDLEEEDSPGFTLIEQEKEEEISQPEEVISEIQEQDLKDELTQINHGVSAEQMAIRSRQRMERLRNISMKLRTPSGLTDLESQPAYKRRDVELDNISHSSESEVSKFTLGQDSDDNPVIKPNNFSFLSSVVFFRLSALSRSFTE